MIPADAGELSPQPARRASEVRRRVIMCCDGTWNHPDELGATGVRAPTNVAKVAVGVARHDANDMEQLVYYHAGVGTRYRERLRGGAFGYGLSHDVRECYRYLVEVYEPGDELYFFGFSRGAYTARSVVGLIYNSGILHREHRNRLGQAYRLYKSRDPKKEPRAIAAKLFRRAYAHDPDEVNIHFVGVWDTVGAMGIPITGLPMPKLITKRYGFHDTGLNKQVRHAYQALAIDEHRGPFQPVLWTRKEKLAGQTLEQVWFAGAHRDVGGGEEEPGLSEVPLMWMVNRASACRLEFKPHHFVHRTAPAEPTDEQLLARALGEWVCPDPLGPAHPSLKGPYKWFAKVLGPNLRPIGGAGAEKRDTELAGENAASSAIARLPAYPNGQPANLLAWREHHKEAIDVLSEAGKLVDPWPPA